MGLRDARREEEVLQQLVAAVDRLRPAFALRRRLEPVVALVFHVAELGQLLDRVVDGGHLDPEGMGDVDDTSAAGLLGVAVDGFQIVFQALGHAR